MPELPTIAEIYPGYEALIWQGLFAPAGTPQPIVDRLRAELKVVLAQPELAKGSPTRAPASLTSRRRRSSPPASRATTRSTAS